MKKGEVTAFLSLIFLLLLTVTASVVESASIQVMKNRRRGDMDRALESVFAEYQREMLEEFDVFSLEGTYGTGEFNEENVIKRLEFYGMRDAEQKTEKIQFLTDESGNPFREQVIAYMKHRVGVSQMEELAGLTGEWKNQTGKAEVYEQDGTRVEKSLEESLKAEEQTLPEKDNPIGVVSSLKQIGLVNLVMKNKDVSNKAIEAGGMLTHRSLKKGWGDFKMRDDIEGVTANLYFASYLMEKFHAADQPYSEGKLSYELEFILNGEESDRENLEAVLKKLLGIRLASNYGYLLTDSGKKAEAGAMALALAGVIALPALTEVIKQGILLAWAFGESIMDLRALVSGGRVSLVKGREDWNLSLDGLLKLGTAEDTGVVKKTDQGLSYKEYLRMLLIFEKQEECTMRSLSMLENRIREKVGDSFQVDHCISKIKIKAKCHLRRKIYYEFGTEYGYQ